MANSNVEDEPFLQFADELFINESDHPNNVQPTETFISPLQVVHTQLAKYTKSLFIGHINASSVPKHIDELRRILVQTKLDILGITETFIKGRVPEDRLQIEGYKLYNVNRTSAEQGGLAIYIRKEIQTEVKRIPQDANFPELMCTTITINNKKIAIAVIYKRPIIPYKKIDHIIERLGQITCTYDDTIIMGDINIDMLNSRATDHKYFVSNVIEPLSLHQVIDKPTRITDNSSKCIDIIMVSNKEKCLVSGVAPTYSDNHLVFMAYVRPSVGN